MDKHKFMSEMESIFEEKLEQHLDEILLKRIEDKDLFGDMLSEWDEDKIRAFTKKWCDNNKVFPLFILYIFESLVSQGKINISTTEWIEGEDGFDLSMERAFTDHKESSTYIEENVMDVYLQSKDGKSYTDIEFNTKVL